MDTGNCGSYAEMQAIRASVTWDVGLGLSCAVRCCGSHCLG